MTALQPIDRLDTHDVFNQVPPFENRNLFTGDRALVDAVNCAGAGEHGARLAALGQRCGSAEVIEWGVEANRQPPCSKPMTAMATASTRCAFIPPITT